MIKHIKGLQNALSNRNLIEAVSLSLAFHLIFAFFILIGHPLVLQHRQPSDLYFRFEERTPFFAQGELSPFDPPAQLAPRDKMIKIYWEDWDRFDAGQLEKNLAQGDERPDPAWEMGGNVGVDPRDIDLKEKRGEPLINWSQKIFDNIKTPATPCAANAQEHRASNGIAFYNTSQKEHASSALPSLDVDQLIEPTNLLRNDARSEGKKPGLALDGFSPPSTCWELSKAMPHSPCEDLANSENFSVQTKLYRRSQGSDLLLQATYQPKEGAVFRKAKQHVIFLIDRSSALGFSRFITYKKAVLSALDQLNEDETFNILFFDRKIVRFSQTPLLATEPNLKAAKAFVNKEKLGGFFSSADLCPLLDQLDQLQIDETRVNSALLLTSGETRQSRERQRRSIARFSNKNDGKMALYVFAQGSKNNLPLLEILAHFNKGRLFHLQDQEPFIDQFKAFSITLRYPIGKEMLATAISNDGPAIQLLPKSGQQGDLYPNLAYQVLGVWPSTNASGVYLYLQGRNRGDWLDIRCKVQPDHRVEEVDAQIEQRYAILRAFEHYGNYIDSAELQELKKAQEILNALGYPTAFS